MVKVSPIPELLHQARLRSGLDVDSLARQSGVAATHIVDLEAGVATSFHSLAYCRNAALMLGRSLGIENEVSEAWQDAHWQGGRAKGAAGLTELEATPSTLLPPAHSGNAGFRKWLLPVFGLFGLAAVGWLASHRLGSEAVEPRVIESRAIAPTETAAATPAVDAAASAAAFKTGVEKSMEEWAALWTARNPAAYRALYNPAAPGMTEHLANRTNRMQRAQFVQVQVRDAVYQESGPGEITVRFRQVYRSDTFRSEDTKELVWRQTPDGPRIEVERTLP